MKQKFCNKIRCLNIIRLLKEECGDDDMFEHHSFPDRLHFDLFLVKIDFIWWNSKVKSCKHFAISFQLLLKFNLFYEFNRMEFNGFLRFLRDPFADSDQFLLLIVHLWAFIFKAFKRDFKSFYKIHKLHKLQASTSTLSSTSLMEKVLS